MRMAGLLGVPVLAGEIEHGCTHDEAANRHDHENCELLDAHGFIPFRVRLASKCNAVAAEKQITVPMATRIPGPPAL